MPATLRRHILLALCGLTLLCAACSSSDSKGTSKGAGDASLQFDSNLNPQDSKDPDTGTPSLDGVSNDDVSANCPGGAGCPCAENIDCETGLCIDDPSLAEGRACARPCGSQCPSGYLCRPLTGPAGDISNFCVPHYGHLCDPCATSKDCQALGLGDAACTNQGKLGQFCGVACQVSADCPKSYTCETVPSAEGPSSKQCVRAPDQPGGPYGVCECSKSAASKGLHTTCAVEVKGAEGQVLGTCTGTRTCTAAGLGDCTAPPVQPETCNGLDDNCNGQTDEGSCDDKNGCTQDSCDGTTGTGGGCKHVALDGTSCDADGSACTPDDTCKAGTCVAGAPLACNDKNPCTKDSCDLALGCTHTEANGVPCEDDNPCTIGDLCSAGQCQPGPAKLCMAPDGCQTASCDLQSGNCKYGIAPDTTPCDDGLLCTTADGCSGGTCKGTPKQCDDGNPCTQDLCEPKSGCAASSQGAIACDDGNACTSGDACQSGSCVGKASLCDDENPCTADTCDVKLGCAHTDTSDACDDGNPCSKGDACAGGKCVPGGSVCACQQDADCPDDGNLCNGLTFCDKSGGTAKCAIAPLSLVLCSSSLDTDCSKSQCEPTTGKCAMKALGDGSLCEDGSACTAGDACAGGICKSGSGLSCDDGNGCTADSCDAAAGCVHAAQNGVACDADGSACTQGDACNGGVCGKGPAMVCDDGNACTTDSCDPLQGCLFAPNTAVCSDGNPCTQGDACAKGACVPGASVCACQKDTDCPNDGNLCNGVEFCDTTAAPYVCKLKPGSVVTCDVSKDGPCSTTECAVKTGLCGPVAKQDGASCSDGSACTAGDACAGGSCLAGAKVGCDDGNPCTADSCDAAKGCVSTANADGALCPGGTCKQAVCKAFPAGCGDMSGLQAGSPWPMKGGCPTRNGRSQYVGGQTNALKWKVAMGAVYSSPVIAADDTVYIGSGDNNLHAIAPSGKQKWQFLTAGNVTSSAAIGADGTVYVGSSDAKLYAVSPAGQQKWQFSADASVYSSPAVGADGAIYFTAQVTNNQTLYAVDGNGQLKWKFASGNGGNGACSPALGGDGTVYFVSRELYAFAANGQLLWKSPSSYNFAAGPAVAANGAVIMVGDVYPGGTGVFAVDALGQLLWQSLFNNYYAMAFQGQPSVAADGTLLVAAVEKYPTVYAITSAGQGKWTYSLPDPLAGGGSGQATQGADGVVYVGTGDGGGANGSIFAITAGGQKKWQFGITGIVQGSAAIGADGTLYVGSVSIGSNTGYLFAIGP